jgi:hypothetical protein
MDVREISLNAASIVAAIGLILSLSTLNLVNNNTPTTFAQSTTTPINKTQSTISSPFKSGVFVMPMTCTTPNDLIRSLGQLAGSNDTTANSMIMQMMKNQMMTSGNAGHNMTERQLKQAVNMEVCFPSTLSATHRNMTGMGQLGQSSNSSMILP